MFAFRVKDLIVSSHDKLLDYGESWNSNIVELKFNTELPFHLQNISEHVIPQIASLALSSILKSSEKAGKLGQFSNIHYKFLMLCTQIILISYKMGPNTLPETKNRKLISIIVPEIKD